MRRKSAVQTVAVKQRAAVLQRDHLAEGQGSKQPLDLGGQRGLDTVCRPSCGDTHGNSNMFTAFYWSGNKFSVSICVFFWDVLQVNLDLKGFMFVHGFYVSSDQIQRLVSRSFFILSVPHSAVGKWTLNCMTGFKSWLLPTRMALGRLHTVSFCTHS